jgi:hypothetical protein
MSGNQRTILVTLGLAILCGLIALAAIVVYTYLNPPPDDPIRVALGTPPVVLITSPEMGQQIPVGQMVMVHAVARGEAKVARVELWIDGQLHSAQNSSLPGGTSPFPLVTPWQPASAGAHTLTARTFDMQGERAQATVKIEATSADDRDDDGVPDEFDACPDEPGWQATGGCPDRDGDNFPDTQDACPDEAGLSENGGCPSPYAGDRDGDGVPDDDDRCPDEPGMSTLDGCQMPSDRDGDEIADEDDACPDALGPPETGGCPDRDSDGIVDGADACPDDPGPPESGCPAPSGDDRDGDGFPDDIDRCPDEPGVRSTLGCPDRDGDTVADGEDACPDDFGPPENGGCPEDDGGGPGSGPPGSDHDTDSDGDGIPDAEDSCPGASGLPENEGCPDRDGDTVPDYRDMCLDEAGPPENLGCPESGTGDRDGDGVLDDVDRCPDEAGLPEHDGCPPPDEDDTDLPAPLDSEEVVWPGGPSTSVEFQVLSLQVSDDYDGVYCYPSLTALPVERYAFEPLGERQWSVPEDLGSRRILVDLPATITVQMTCGGDNVHFGEGGGWGVYWGMGSIDETHPPTDWDGHVITARSFGGDGGRWFEAQYRLCNGSCDSAAFQPPLLLLIHGRESTLYWQWDGIMGQLAGYSVYVNGNRVKNMRSSDRVSFWGVNAYEPTCGSRRKFSVTAFGDDGLESPPSNVVVWEAAPCPRVVRVTFDAITTYDLGDDEWWAEGESVGPIGGTFWAFGSTYEKLDFNAVDYPNWAWERVRGYRLRHTHYYPIQSIFDQVRTWILGSMSSPYHVPDHNYVTVELGPEDDLIFGGVILDIDAYNCDTLFRGQHTIRAGEIRPGRYTIWDRNIRLTVLVDMLVGPEVGPNPDLTITNVDVHEASGQMRVHVFNNASDMPAPADVTVHWVRVGTTEVVDSYTWQNVQIPSGGRRILQTSESVGPTGGMLFVLDPNEAIPDENRGNNTFETPVAIRFEFLEVGKVGACNDAVCWLFDCDGEFIFKLWVGYGPSADGIVWVGRNLRFPREKTLTCCGHDICRSWESPDEAWIMAGDDRYAFEFSIPAGQNLYVIAQGEENDPAPERDDPLGRIFVEYTPSQNWGARPDEHEAHSPSEEISCDDLGCYKCRYGFRVNWLITRLR